MGRSIRLKDKMELCLYWRYYIQCQLPLLEAVHALARNHPHKKLQALLWQVEEGLRRGQKLSSTLKLFPKVFDQVFIQLMYVAEQVGDYGSYLEYAERYLFWRWQMMNLLGQALRYPLILMGLILLLFGLVDYLLLPQMLQLFSSLGISSYPWSTLIFIRVMEWLPWLVIGAAAGVFFLWFWNKEKIPLMGRWFKKIYLMIFIQQLGILLQAKVDLLSALTVAAQATPNPGDYEVLAQKLKQGLTLSKAMGEEKIVDITLHPMVELGEKTGRLGEILMNYSHIELELLKQRIIGWVNLIQPLLVMVMGAILMGFIGGVLWPLYQVIIQHA